MQDFVHQQYIFTRSIFCCHVTITRGYHRRSWNHLSPRSIHLPSSPALWPTRTTRAWGNRFPTSWLLHDFSLTMCAWDQIQINVWTYQGIKTLFRIYPNNSGTYSLILDSETSKPTFRFCRKLMRGCTLKLLNIWSFLYVSPFLVSNKDVRHKLHENKTHNKINDSDPQLCISSCASNNPPNTAACKLRQERLQELRIVHGTYRKIKHQS